MGRSHLRFLMFDTLRRYRLLHGVLAAALLLSASIPLVHYTCAMTGDTAVLSLLEHPCSILCPKKEAGDPCSKGLHDEGECFHSEEITQTARLSAETMGDRSLLPMITRLERVVSEMPYTSYPSSSSVQHLDTGPAPSSSVPIHVLFSSFLM